MSDPDPVVQIIDDDAAVRNRLGSLLDTAGIRARTHESTTAFLAIADSLPPGCIVSEISMPDIDGLELVARLKAMGRCCFPEYYSRGNRRQPGRHTSRCLCA